MYLLKDSVISLDWSQLKVSDLVNLGALAIGFLGAFIAIASFFVAVSQLQQAVKDGDEQRKSLDASREQLQAVVDSLKSQQHLQSQSLETSRALLTIQERQVNTIKEQQNVLTESLETSKSLLALQKKEQERLQDLANRKPKILAILDNQLITESKVEATIPFDKETNRAILPLLIRNVGSASAQTAHFTAFSRNKGITLWFESAISDVKRPFRSQIEWKSLLSFQGSQTTYNSNIYISAPNTVSELDLSFSVTAENLDSPFIIDFHLHLNRT